MSAPHSPLSKRALIVGATGSLGSAITQELASAHWSLLLTGRNANKLTALGDRVSSQVIPADLSKSQERSVLMDSIKFPLDAFVFAAGVAPISPLKYTREDDLENALKINLTLPLLLTRDLLKQKKLNPGASIVWISSIAATRGTAGYSGYAASKAGLEAAARCLSVELSGKRIRINCVAPGMVSSAMELKASEDISPEAMEAHKKHYPLGIGRPSDVAQAVAYLLSDAAQWVTGTVLKVDGGFSAS